MKRIQPTSFVLSYLSVFTLLFALSALTVPALAVDADGDGYEPPLDCVDNPSGVGGVPGAQIHPGATEIWYDGVDQNCDGWNDYDQDKDSYVEIGYSGKAGGTSPYTGDCNDTNASIHPGAADIPGNGIDEDCDGADAMIDADGDGYYSISSGGDDCDDTDNTVYPMAPERCDGVDTDCDGEIPDSEIDNDSDGYVECTIDAGGWDGNPAVVGGGDCDDANAAVHPGAAEIWYDGVDQNCDGASDFDQDGDGHEAVSHGGDDCDDTAAAIRPGAAEIWYDGVDQDCDSWNDYDQDKDGYVSEDFPGQSGGTSPFEGDCDDTDDTVYPMASELCDGLDNDCDGAIPDLEIDHDTDGYVECAIDAGGWDGDPGVIGGDDCDDSNSAIHPYATEIPNNGMDEDCDGLDLIACTYELAGDLDGDCTVNLTDLAILAGNWLVDCMVEPVDPACVPLP